MVTKELEEINGKIVLDLGGGTSLYRRGEQYICLDLDKNKLGKDGILANATNIPLADNCIDLILCIAVTHHLTNPELELMVQESHRVLKETGKFILIDAVRTNRLLSKMMWKYDRGSYPRTYAEIISTIGQRFNVVRIKRFKRLHEYILLENTR